MRKVIAAILALSSFSIATPAPADIIRTEQTLAGKTFCWWSGWDSEQYNRDHTYIYSYHVLQWGAHQYVLHGTWALSRDGTVILTMEAGGVLTRRYDLDGDHVKEVSGTLDGGSDGHPC